MAIGKVCPLSMPIIIPESPELELDRVKKSDIVRIALIYNGDLYWSDNDSDYNKKNGYRPRNNHDARKPPPRPDDIPKTVDCCNYVTQLLRRLARLNHDTHIDPGTGDYPIDHSSASWWNTDREDEVIHLPDYW